jgi:hypothetical protein
MENTTQNTGNIKICYITKAATLHNWRPSSPSATTDVLEFQGMRVAITREPIE